MMNHCAIQQKNVYVPKEDIDRDYVVCPKPRRAGILNSSVRSAGLHMSHQVDVYDSTAGTGHLDIILSKGGGQDSEQISYPHLSPFFNGSPPSRVSNPLIQDPRFVEVKEQQSSLTPSHWQNPIINSGLSSSSSSSSRMSGFVRNNFGNNPAVRVEGFVAMNRDRRGCGIPTFA